MRPKDRVRGDPVRREVVTRSVQVLPRENTDSRKRAHGVPIQRHMHRLTPLHCTFIILLRCTIFILLCRERTGPTRLEVRPRTPLRIS